MLVYSIAQIHDLNNKIEPFCWRVCCFYSKNILLTQYWHVAINQNLCAGIPVCYDCFAQNDFFTGF